MMTTDVAQSLRLYVVCLCVYVVSETFNVEKYQDLEIQVNGQ